MTVIFDKRTNEIVKLDSSGFKVCSLRLEMFEMEQLVKAMNEHLEFIQGVKHMNELAFKLYKEEHKSV